MTKKYKQLKDTWRIKAGEEWTQLNEDLTLYLHYGTQTLEKESVIKENPSWFQEITEPKQSFKKWRAECGGTYYSITHIGIIYSNMEVRDTYDNYHYLTGNYFQTKQEAEAYKARQEAIGRVTHAIIEANEGKVGTFAIVWRRGSVGTMHVDYLKGTIVPLLIPAVVSEDIALSIISSHKEDLDLIFNNL
jgi:hypothetical protein